jgi:hypothetical protein
METQAESVALRGSGPMRNFELRRKVWVMRYWDCIGRGKDQASDSRYR